MTTGRFVHFSHDVDLKPVRWRVLSQERTPNGIVRLITREGTPQERQVAVRAGEIDRWDVA